MTRDDLFDSIIPTTMTKLSNKKVQRKIDCIKKCGGICKTYENDIEDLKDLGENSLKVIHEDTLCQKYKIEDKAKALTFISTIAATLAVALLTASSQTLVEERLPSSNHPGLLHSVPSRLVLYGYCGRKLYKDFYGTHRDTHLQLCR